MIFIVFSVYLDKHNCLFYQACYRNYNNSVCLLKGPLNGPKLFSRWCQDMPHQKLCILLNAIRNLFIQNIHDISKSISIELTTEGEGENCEVPVH